VKEALGAFGPVLAGRGVVQLAGYVDLFLASFLAAGAIAALGYAQTLYLLPISLFAMSVAAAELPELSRLGRADSSRTRELLDRVRRSLRQMAVLNVPTFVGYLAFGYLIVGLLFRRERFGVQDNWLVYLVLCGYTLGLLASTSSRLLQNTFYALGETRTPARIATLRVAVSAGLGAALMVWLDRYPVASLTGVGGTAGEPLFLGAVGLALASGVGAWLELLLLRRSLASRVEGAVLPVGEMAKMIGLALAAAVPAALVGWWLRGLPLVTLTVLVVGLYAALYLLLVRLAMPQELDVWIGRFGRRFRQR
jgi:putative peptidoglycan lipid II flippase